VPLTGKVVTTGQRSRATARPTTPADIDYILSVGLRAADVQEVTASGYFPNAAVAFRGSVELSKGFCFTVLIDGVPAGAFGATPDAVPWLLGTELMTSLPIHFLREAPLWVSLLNSVYPVLTNYVHVENTHAYRWLKRLGATFHEDHQIGGLTFRRFELCAIPPQSQPQ